MAVSVRMEAMRERELELAAQRRGIRNSQFIIEAVESALGRKDPGLLLLQVREEFAPLRAAEAAAGGAVQAPGSRAGRLRAPLRARHEADVADWAQRAASKAEITTADTVVAKAKPAARKRRGRAA